MKGKITGCVKGFWMERVWTQNILTTSPPLPLLSLALHPLLSVPPLSYHPSLTLFLPFPFPSHIFSLSSFFYVLPSLFTHTYIHGYFAFSALSHLSSSFSNSLLFPYQLLYLPSSLIHIYNIYYNTPSPLTHTFYNIHRHLHAVKSCC